MQIVTGIEVNSEAYFPKLWEYYPSAEGMWAICPQLREIRPFLPATSGNKTIFTGQFFDIY